MDTLSDTTSRHPPDGVIAISDAIKESFFASISSRNVSSLIADVFSNCRGGLLRLFSNSKTEQAANSWRI